MGYLAELSSYSLVFRLDVNLIWIIKYRVIQNDYT